jgi:hypothetical protein
VLFSPESAYTRELTAAVPGGGLHDDRVVEAIA